MREFKIPFNQPFLAGKELYYIAQSVLSGHTAGDGLFTKKCHALMEKKFGAKKILLTHSCTAALEMAAILCEVGPGDEVILPSFTFVSTANAFYLRGAKLVFIDMRADRDPAFGDIPSESDCTQNIRIRPLSDVLHEEELHQNRSQQDQSNRIE